MEGNKPVIDKIYRYQSAVLKASDVAKSSIMDSQVFKTSRKAIIISNNGDMSFNGNGYIYFSKSIDHHGYYILMKVIKIISSEYEEYCKKMGHVDNEYQTTMHEIGRLKSTHIGPLNVGVIRRLRDFFYNYIPPQYVELITFNYLHAFTDFVENFAISNNKKDAGVVLPEFADTGINGGGYGLPNTWLQLLKCCVESTETSHMSIVSCLNYLVDVLPDVKYISERSEFKNCQEALSLGLLKHVKYSKLSNPQFTNKNNINDVKKYLKDIENGLESQGIQLDEKNFKSYRTALIEDIKGERSRLDIDKGKDM